MSHSWNIWPQLSWLIIFNTTIFKSLKYFWKLLLGIRNLKGLYTQSGFVNSCCSLILSLRSEEEDELSCRFYLFSCSVCFADAASEACSSRDVLLIVSFPLILIPIISSALLGEQLHRSPLVLRFNTHANSNGLMQLRKCCWSSLRTLNSEDENSIVASWHVVTVVTTPIENGQKIYSISKNLQGTHSIFTKSKSLIIIWTILL